MNAVAAHVFADLDRYEQAIPIEALLRWLHEVPVTVEDVAEVLAFDAKRYVRNLWHAGPAFQALVLCWRNGQRSPIHDHTGSNCAVRVLRGVATETVFDRAPNGLVVPTSSRELPEGHLCASVDSDIHQVSNLQADDRDLITLHVYSPPLTTMNIYSLESPEVRLYDEPIRHWFAQGGGI
jgi:cysteine dioxygenase